MGLQILRGKCLSQEVVSVLMWIIMFCPISHEMLAGRAVDMAAPCLVRLALGSRVLRQDSYQIKVGPYGCISNCDELRKWWKVMYET
jgi:hypothetical protein